MIRDFLSKHETTLVPQPPYALDLAPAAFFLFAKLKFVHKGRRFAPVEDIKENSLTELSSAPTDAFHECLQSWNMRWERCTGRSESL
jgi:hypothetical protein